MVYWIAVARKCADGHIHVAALLCLTVDMARRIDTELENWIVGQCPADSK